MFLEYDRLRFGDETWVRVVEGTPSAEWCYWPPDQLGTNPDYGGNGNVRTAAPAPGIILMGELNNHHYTHNTRMDKRWQLFDANLLSLHEYGRPYDELTDAQRAIIAAAFRGMHGDRKAFCNHQGFNPKDAPDRADFVTPRDTGGELPQRVNYLGCVTNSGKILEQKINSHGVFMSRIQSFIWEDGPPIDYGIEILQHPAIWHATIQKADGTVDKFPNLSKGVLYAFRTLRDFPAWYPDGYLWHYTGARRKPYNL